MVRRIVSLSVVASIAFFVLAVRGEEPATKPPAPPAAPSTTGVPASATSNPDADLAARVAALERQVALLERSNQALIRSANDHTSVVADLQKQVADLERSNKEFTNIANDHSKMLRDIARGIDTPSGQRFVPNVQAISDDPQSSSQLVKTVVQGMVRNSGELRIRNDMSTGQSLVINGVTTVYVPPHEGRVVTVPSGTATTELAGEGTKSWMIGAPNYTQEVIIAPALRSTVGFWQYDPASNTYWRTLP